MKDIPQKVLDKIEQEKLMGISRTLSEDGRLVYVEFIFETEIIGVSLDCSDEDHGLKFRYRKKTWKLREKEG